MVKCDLGCIPSKVGPDCKIVVTVGTATETKDNDFWYGFEDRVEYEDDDKAVFNLYRMWENSYDDVFFEITLFPNVKSFWLDNNSGEHWSTQYSGQFIKCQNLKKLIITSHINSDELCNMIVDLPQLTHLELGRYCAGLEDILDQNTTLTYISMPDADWASDIAIRNRGECNIKSASKK